MSLWRCAYHWRFDRLTYRWECWVESCAAMHMAGWVTVEADDQSGGKAREWFVERLRERMYAQRMVAV